ncbi:MAG: aminotransferase class I/II-fold pyridoxal phosphate-dependent enzyme [Coprococcus sp.]|nr:aminotransferase class I/II-fold pyridoxal phosphate-dependent enzyme [Coprococcus sp.]
MEKITFHGSDLELIEKYYHIPKEHIINFGANVNPLGISPKLRKSLEENIDAIQTYPDREYTDLRQSLSEYCGAPVSHILVGSGATDLISRFIKSLAPKKALLIDPTYSEYAREVALEGGSLVSFPLLEEDDFKLDKARLFRTLDPSFDMVILCNPNNPTGTAVYQNDLCEILDFCLKRDIYLLIDETYVEFADDMEEITAIPLTEKYENLFVLRGISKFFAAPGLRLGYGVTGSRKLYGLINDSKNPWSINSLAAACAPEMFRDAEYIAKTKEFIQKERSRLLSKLSKESCLHVYRPSSNFVLLKILNPDVTSQMVFEHTIRDGLMLRDCSSFPGLGDNHIRFCFCMPDENDRLIAKILEAVRQ